MVRGDGTPDHCCYGRLDGRTMRPPEYGGIEVVPVRADGRYVSAAAVYCGMAVVVSTDALVATGKNKDRFAKGARNKDKNAIVYIHLPSIWFSYFVDGGGIAGNKLVGGLEQSVGITGIYGRDRAVDAGAGRGGDDADRAVSERARRRAIVGEYRFDGVITRHGGRVNVPRRRAVVYFAQTCGGMGDGDIVFGHTHAVLRFCAAYVVGCIVRLCVSVDRQSVGADCDAFHQQCDYGGGLLDYF